MYASFAEAVVQLSYISKIPLDGHPRQILRYLHETFSHPPIAKLSATLKRLTSAVSFLLLQLCPCRQIMAKPSELTQMLFAGRPGGRTMVH
jgi:hypothetical protein